MAEAPGLLFTAFAIDLWGRRRSQYIQFSIVAASVFMLVFTQGQGVFSTIILFVSRAFILGAFTVTYVYTPEVYPTSVRSSAFGLANGWARIGGMLCPIASVQLLEEGYLSAVAIIYTVVCLSAAVASYMLPIETSGAELQDTVAGTATIKDVTSKTRSQFTQLEDDQDHEHEPHPE
mmetsp:Transcript_34832/g.75318  ORF Transcript_34832/g.75318 Transcript_34832/m.75318 type:complete len:177 (-) Transcript_34832:25-555(-)